MPLPRPDMESLCENCAIGKVALYGPTLERARDGISHSRSGTRLFAPQKRIYRRGETPTEVHTIRSGWAMRYVELTNGRRQILSFLIPGDTIAIETLWIGDTPLPFSIKTITELRSCAFPVTAFRTLIHGSPEQAQELTATARRMLESFYARFADLGQRSAEGRIAHLVIDITKRLKRRDLMNENSIYFPLTREHIADATGLTAVHVSRTLGALKKDGLLMLEGQTLTILDCDALVDRSEDL